MNKLDISFIIPVFNRPEEIRELLESFLELEGDINYEIVIVEDGSTNKSDDVCNAFKGQLDISYYYKENSGPGDSRNFGMQKAKGKLYMSRKVR